MICNLCIMFHVPKEPCPKQSSMSSAGGWTPAGSRRPVSGELVQHLPTGLVRDAAGVVRLDPDQSVQDRIRLAFDKFRELGGAQKVLRYMAKSGLKLPRRQTSGTPTRARCCGRSRTRRPCSRS